MDVTYYELLLHKFKLKFVIDNLNLDSELNNSEKNTFLEFINSHKIDSNTEFNKFIAIMNMEFFFRNQFLRISERGLVNSGNLGHVVTKTKFYEIIKQNIDSKSPELIDSKDEFLNGFFDNFDFEIYKLSFKNVPIGRFIMWSFQNDTLEKNVFSNLPQSEIACILGLDDETINNEKIAIEHFTTELIVRPTLFDAGINEFWIPGGRTKPRVECETHSGLKEFVHKPSVFQNIVHRQLIR